MWKLMHEFRNFAVRGNVAELAIAVVIGGAFGKIVTSLVDNIITPFIGVLLGGVDFTGYVFQVGSATFKYGEFVQAIVDFVIIAFVIFIAIKLLRHSKEKEEKTTEAKVNEEIVLLREIRDALKR